MAQRRVQYNNGPAMLDLINFVPGDDFNFLMTINHDITSVTFDAGIETARGDPVALFTVSGVAPLASGIASVTMGAVLTALVTDKCKWYLDETNAGVHKTLLAGNIEVYLK
jgi:hypothetical protein